MQSIDPHKNKMIISTIKTFFNTKKLKNVNYINGKKIVYFRTIFRTRM